jgi:hypothetical protein
MTHPALTAEVVAALLVDTEPYLSCDDCFALLDTWAERRVADPGHDAHGDTVMETHLAGCGACAEEAAALLDLVAGATAGPATS